MRTGWVVGAVVMVWFLCMVASVRSAEQYTVSLKVEDRVVLTYNARYIPSPDVNAPWFGRSGFIHPVCTPGGRVVTDGFPVDHLHQHGLMFAWTTARIDGREVDFWNSAKQQGRVEHAETVRSDNETLVVRLRHIDETGEEPTVALRETWRITRVPHTSMHVFDLVSVQTCAADRPVLMEQYHYGGMCVRGAAAWIKDIATMVTSEGNGRADGNHTRPRWVAMYGAVDGAVCGIAALSHPDDFRAPQPVRLHPTMPYFCFTPMVSGDFRIEPGKPYVSRYRFAAFDGEVKPEQLNALWRQYAATR